MYTEKHSWKNYWNLVYAHTKSMFLHVSFSHIFFDETQDVLETSFSFSAEKS